MVQTLLLSYQSTKDSCEWYPGQLSLSTGAGLVRTFTKKNMEATEQYPENPSSPISKEDGSAVSTRNAAPKFPSPSECSKWLMLFWFAGFPPAKIHSLLSKYFSLGNHKAYHTENIEATFHRLQASADHNTGDYKADPYMYYLMTSKSSSPFEFRQNAIKYLERHHFQLVNEMTGDVEIMEMNCWHQRWMEEVRLMKKSKDLNYRLKACTFEEELDHYAPHFDAKGFSAYLENKSTKHFRRSKSAAPSPERKPASTRRSEEITSRDNNGRKITNIQRPQLSLTTKMGHIIARTKPESAATPTSAQHLDDLGFFAQRPAPSSTSVIGARTRTPSLQSADSHSVSSASLHAQSLR